MSTHPNAILAVALTPDDLARKTYRAILEYCQQDINYEDPDFKLDNERYHISLMEEAYHESWQLSASEGDIVAHGFLTYGYGDTLRWEEVEDRKKKLENWALEMCRRFNCTYKIFITANYW